MRAVTWLVGFVIPMAVPLSGQPVWAQHTVDVSVSADVAGQTISPGTTVNWEITAEITAGDGLGLALISVDFLQNPANPEQIALPPGDTLPAGMESFLPPNGITNPGAPPLYGFGGTPSGNNLKQIGGGQNTSGAVTVVGDVGVGSAQVVAEGSFSAPSTVGLYEYQIESAVARVLDAINAPPECSPVSPATITMGTAAFQFTVQMPSCICGDIDGSGGGSNLADFATFAACYGYAAPNPPDCDEQALACSDLDGNGTIDLADFATFAAFYGLDTTYTVPSCILP
ncbi:MAG: hypothetical protein JSU68_01720 [Phycisphaerales bacterium]|nr:MAG: hypothetical protein JSU68_01720 [Phycisphaerales bacterium]